MSYYEILLESEKTGTLTYATPSELGYSSYKEFLSSVNQPLSVFEPVINMRGIDRNYILEIPDSAEIIEILILLLFKISLAFILSFIFN